MVPLSCSRICQVWKKFDCFPKHCLTSQSQVIFRKKLLSSQTNLLTWSLAITCLCCKICFSHKEINPPGFYLNAVWILHVKYINIHLCWNLEAWLGLSLLTLNHEFIEIFLSIVFLLWTTAWICCSVCFCSVTSVTFSQQKGYSCSQFHHPWNPL